MNKNQTNTKHTHSSPLSFLFLSLFKERELSFLFSMAVNGDHLRSNFARQRSDTPRDLIAHINRFQVQNPNAHLGKVCVGVKRERKERLIFFLEYRMMDHLLGVQMRKRTISLKILKTCLSPIEQSALVCQNAFSPLSSFSRSNLSFLKSKTP